MLIEIPQLNELIQRLDSLERFITEIRKREKPEVKEWYSVKEAAVYLNVSVKTIRRLVDRGLLKKSLGLRIIRIPADSLRAYRQATVSK